jgi:hypothetical protein
MEAQRYLFFAKCETQNAKLCAFPLAAIYELLLPAG